MRTGLATSKEVAEDFRMTEAALAQMRYRGEGPRYVKVGKRVRYRWEDVDEWLRQQTFSGTSEHAATVR